MPRVILPEGISRFVRRSVQIKVRARNIVPVRVIRPIFGIDSDSCLGLFQILHFQSDVRQVIRFVFLRIVLPLLLREDLRGLEGVGGGGGVVGLRSVRRLSVQGVVRQRLGCRRLLLSAGVASSLRGHDLGHRRFMHIGREVGSVEGAAARYDRGRKVVYIIPRLELHGAVLAVGEARQVLHEGVRFACGVIPADGDDQGPRPFAVSDLKVIPIRSVIPVLHQEGDFP
ncbi:hypothetical protein, partial [uncultured Intestinimonas sp.]|uniref:hypothetical protein n=1 Tax=uncultured Intestinimonas sp. TaxID=1689265 RepID=UPI0025D05602